MSEPSYMAIRFETLQQAQDDLGMAYAAVQQTIEVLEGELKKGLAEWSGSARDAYGPIKAQWDAAIEHMASVLSKAHVHMANAAEMYQAVENQNVSIWHA
ncbi:MAG TPA: WXG100 family type VII secretion target [Streptosporangiaceae bacterium]|jgi:WXG100 family type VII secretion target|nr:WXG100 family type VII secretion target [Streptosporangiaceae bacterium]